MSCVFTKDPDATLDYQFDWSDWLPSGDTISSSSLIIPNGLTLESESNTTNQVTAWLSGGVAGTDYTITNRIVTVAGRTDDRSAVIKVEDR